MERRQFLKWLGLGAGTAAGVAAGVVDPERLAWVPGQKALFDIQPSPLYHPDAFSLVSDEFRGMSMPMVASDELTGISMRMVRDYAIDADRFPTRLDVLYGWAVVRPELACKITDELGDPVTEHSRYALIRDELTLEQFSDRYMKPAIEGLFAKADDELRHMYVEQSRITSGKALELLEESRRNAFIMGRRSGKTMLGLKRAIDMSRVLDKKKLGLV